MLSYMLLQITPNLENLILALLQQSPCGLSANDLRQLVGKRWKAYSRRGIYKELQRLEAEGVIMRSAGLYSMRLAWLLSLQARVDQMVETASRPESQRLVLPKRGQDIVVTCSDLVRWDRVWTQLMLILHAALPGIPLFQWVPRYWFNLTHPGIQSTFIPAAEALRDFRFSVIGGRTALDFECRSAISRTSSTYTFRPSPFDDDRTHYRNVIGDYMITCSLDQRTAARIDDLFESVKNPKNLPLNIGKKLLALKCRGSVRCSWAPQQAEKCRQKFIKFFGVTLKENGEVLSCKRGEL